MILIPLRLYCNATSSPSTSYSPSRPWRHAPLRCGPLPSAACGCACAVPRLTRTHLRGSGADPAPRPLTALGLAGTWWTRRSRPSPSIAKEASITGVIATSEVVVVASLEDGSGATGGAAGAADGAASVGGGAGVAGSGGWTRPGTAVVIGVEGRHGAEVEAQACLPPRPLAGSGVNPTLYLAFSASGSAFQRWPGAWHGAAILGEKGLRREVRMGMGQGMGQAGGGSIWG